MPVANVGDLAPPGQGTGQGTGQGISPSAITVNAVTKRFRVGNDAITALEEVSLDVRRGEFVAIVGPSGCGKSTLLKILTGLFAPSAGDTRIGGTVTTGPRRDIGVVFQSPLLFPWRTVLENVMLPADVQKLNRATHLTRAKELLDLVGLTDFKDRYPKELSGGMQQRVAIARALLHQPAILLMDEPFGALDAMTRERMNVELQRLWRIHNTSILFITHSIPEAVFLASRVVVMTPRPGRVAEILDINLPAKRPLELMNSPEFGAYVARIRSHFGSVGVID
ncbi:MAG: ABC transporter ATP-binding protein [Rhizobiales bacterium 24-66-13]|jgi:NitT/TauT family transport system ATP-binding protein|nr:MAG: ABC transporter ATP-binding protein [Rhizobiales bacterium 35-66-30]OYZ82132.1 MAG: ABC transporter ATP-binding protein [Rhizobiales bacterium 24-66-13]OZB11033.1 MAG: ABC transporter ATP-binding protein [Rhizobiales bacterium 39-66-18]